MYDEVMLRFYSCFLSGLAGSVATVLHDAVMNPAEGTIMIFHVALSGCFTFRKI